MRRVTLLVILLVASLAVVTRPAVADTAPSLPDGSWPLRPTPEVVRGFEPPVSAWGAGHRGVDLLGRVGEPVRAAAAGTVVFAGSLAGRGVLTVDHGGTRTTYEPVSASVRVGDRVDAGEVVGRLQLAMSHCFPRACLHWGLLSGERYLDPLLLVGQGPVRLLPLDGSRPRVGLLVGLAQAVGGDVGVDLGRGQ
jgi:murein DD-endopeptidase MepM/ murein hydrolase activator NlpD